MSVEYSGVVSKMFQESLFVRTIDMLNRFQFRLQDAGSENYSGDTGIGTAFVSFNSEETKSLWPYGQGISGTFIMPTKMFRNLNGFYCPVLVSAMVK